MTSGSIPYSMGPSRSPPSSPPTPAIRPGAIPRPGDNVLSRARFAHGIAEETAAIAQELREKAEEFRLMDSSHLVLAGLVVLAIVIPIIGFRAMFRRSEKDEAIDAAAFLARRDLRAWLERTRAERSQ